VPDAGPLERVHTGWRLRALYPLGGRFPALELVPPPVRGAIRRGLTRTAVAAHRRLVLRARVVAVTGTAGKTTTKDLLGTMLAAAGPTAITHDNDNGVYGVPATLLAIRPEDRFAVVEAGIRDQPGEMAWLGELIRPEVALLTGIGDDHLPAYGTRDAVLAEKRLLVDRAATAVLLVDDPAVESAAKALSGRVLTAGRAPGADVVLEHARLAWPDGLELRLRIGATRHSGRVRLFAEELAPLVAVAVAGALALDVRADVALAAAAAFRPRAGRLSPAQGPRGSVLLLDEHKSRIANAVMAMDALARIPATRRIAVLGEMQEVPFAAESYAPLAEPAAGLDHVIAVGRAVEPLRAVVPRAAACAGVEEVAAALGELDLGTGDVVLFHAATRQHLLRIALLLAGDDIGCRVRRCSLDWRCTVCPYLRPGPPERVVEAH